MSGSITQQCCPKEPCNTAVALMAASPAWCTSSHMPTLVCYGAQAQGSTSIFATWKGPDLAQLLLSFLAALDL